MHATATPESVRAEMAYRLERAHPQSSPVLDAVLAVARNLVRGAQPRHHSADPSPTPAVVLPRQRPSEDEDLVGAGSTRPTGR